MCILRLDYNYVHVLTEYSFALVAHKLLQRVRKTIARSSLNGQSIPNTSILH